MYSACQSATPRLAARPLPVFAMRHLGAPSRRGEVSRRGERRRVCAHSSGQSLGGLLDQPIVAVRAVGIRSTFCVRQGEVYQRGRQFFGRTHRAEESCWSGDSARGYLSRYSARQPNCRRTRADNPQVKPAIYRMIAVTGQLNIIPHRYSEWTR
jgi:hypothetical protein